MLKIGIEQEFVFTDKAGRYLDADNASYSLFSSIVDKLPIHAGDADILDCKSLERNPRRCYVEGFERHDAAGNVVETIPKGLEIRTLPHDSAEALVNEFRQSYTEAMQEARAAGLAPVLTSMHPFKQTLDIESRLEPWERKVRTEARLKVAMRSMLTHGLHVNVSVAGYGARKMEDLAQKLNYYTPSLVPWSYSSPFCNGRLFDGLCARNHSRAGSRSMADVDERRGVNVLEFRGFDACSDSALLTAVLKLFRGIVEDESLPGRAPVQDAQRLLKSALHGFGAVEFREEGRSLLQAAEPAFRDDPASLELLEYMLENNECSSTRIQRCFAESGSIMECISGRYDF